jgi:hypothetical protein
MMPMMSGMMGMPCVMAKCECTMTASGMTCEMMPMDPAMKSMFMACCDQMMATMNMGMPMMMSCAGMPALCCMPMMGKAAKAA